MSGADSSSSCSRQHMKNDSEGVVSSCGCMNRFATVLLRLPQQHIPLFAATVRKHLSSNTTHPLVDCKLISPPLSGSFHIAFPLHFADGVQWLLKVPAAGHLAAFDTAAAQALRSEALTLRLLKRETDMPVPDVYAFDTGLENELHCPYMLMEYLDGISLQTYWYDAMVNEEERRQILDDLAAAMVRLGRFTFTAVGQPHFDKAERLVGVGPLRKVDHINETSDSKIYYEVGPFPDVQSLLLAMLKRHTPPDRVYLRGIYKLLGRFIDWLAEEDKHPSFVLAHPDFDLQNVLVSADGRLRGLIDWDGVAAMPACFGNMRYPSWLTREWDPLAYYYRGEEMVDGCREDSPADLARYRGIYTCSIVKHLGELAAKEPEDDGASNVHGQNTTLAEQAIAAKLSRSSLVVENLFVAAEDPWSTPGIVDRILFAIDCTHASRITPPHSPDRSRTNGDMPDVLEPVQASPDDLRWSPTSSKPSAEASAMVGPTEEDEDAVKYNGIEDLVYRTYNYKRFSIVHAIGEDRLGDSDWQWLKEGFHALLD